MNHHFCEINFVPVKNLASVEGGLTYEVEGITGVGTPFTEVICSVCYVVGNAENLNEECTPHIPDYPAELGF